MRANILKTSIISILLLLASGCMTIHTNPAYMTAYVHTNELPKTPLQKNLYIESVTGASTAGSSVFKYITDASFEQAVRDSFKSAKLSTNDKNAKYKLLVNMISFEVPTFAILRINVATSISYEIKNAKTNKTIWQDIIRTSASGAAQAAIPPMEEMVRNNINQALKKIIKLKIKEESTNKETGVEQQSNAKESAKTDTNTPKV